MSTQIAIWRILGNDLPPRHAAGQTRTNLQFLLDHEPAFTGTSRHWIVNRIVDPCEEEQILSLLDRAGESYLHLPFSLAEYQAFLQQDLRDYPLAGELPTQQERHRHLKCLYVMNLNSARNLALTKGRQTADWILPLDGNCAFTPDGWARLCDKLSQQPSLEHCFAVPMYRLMANETYFDFSPEQHLAQEPQLVIGRNNPIEFHPLYRYGRYSKVELLKRLNFPYRKLASHEIDAPELLCGYVTRLKSGVSAGDFHWKDRAALREAGIDDLLIKIDTRVAGSKAVTIPLPETRRSITDQDTSNVAESFSNRLSVYSLVTPSHEVLLNEWYLRTLPADCRPRLHFVDAQPVEFGTAHWHKVVVRKFDILDRAFETEAPDSVFVMGDVDIRVYRPFADDIRRRMDGFELLFQSNRPYDPHPFQYLCTGFMAIRCCAAARRFFAEARAVLEKADDPMVGDQVSCVSVLLKNPNAIRFGLLPAAYWAPTRTGSKWVPGVPLTLPADMILHHANYTIGVPNKLAQLTAVETLMQSSQASQSSHRHAG